jgi:hypothetical protein
MIRKISLYIYLTLIIIKPSLSQGYKSVLDSKITEWNIVYSIPDYFPTVKYTSKGDTLIKEKNYKLIFKGNSSTLGNLYGFIREDSIVGKIWFLSLENNEQLIMDMSLNINDTFVFESGAKYSVDTIFYNSGLKYISFNGNNKDSILFIESIGPSSFLYSKFIGNQPSKSQIRCMHKSGKLIFKNTQYSECFDTGLKIDKELFKDYFIYPNPASNTISIESIFNSFYTVEILNSIGIIVLKENVKNNNSLNISFLPSGIYYLKASSVNNIFFSKFIKVK